MPNFSARLRLKKPTPSDGFDTDTIAANWQLVDDFPGTWISAAASPPAWGIPHTGMLWSQSDTGIVWLWNGTSFVRPYSVGSIGSASRTSNFTEAVGTFTTVVQKTGAVVPAGGRRVMLVANWSNITGNNVELRFLRGATVLHDWNWPTGSGGSMTIIDAAVTTGTYTYAFQMRTTSTTSTMVAAATYPIQLEIIEI